VNSKTEYPDINLESSINVNKITYNLLGAIYYTGGHYVYQEYYDKKFQHTYDDSRVKDGTGGYNDNSHRVMILYKKHIDINELKKLTEKSSDEIINQVVEEYCNYRNNITVYGNVFHKDHTYIKYLTQYPNALLIINDNYKNSKTDANGGGNASGQIRQYNIYSFQNHKYEKPRIAGISTGPSGEYNNIVTLNTKLTELDNKTPKEVIDEEIKLIKYIMIVWGYTEIIYSSDENGDLGTAIFKVPDDIKKYIQYKLLKLGKNCYFIEEGKMTKKKIKRTNKYINILN
jgi:hypothetical protein